MWKEEYDIKISQQSRRNRMITDKKKYEILKDRIETRIDNPPIFFHVLTDVGYLNAMKELKEMIDKMEV